VHNEICSRGKAGWTDLLGIRLAVGTSSILHKCWGLVVGLVEPVVESWKL